MGAIPVAVFVTILAYGAVLRSWNLTAAPLWTDEAESSINALSILQHGVPVGQYLGVPVFENVLVSPWPEHPEYEFRDTSYSDKGLAVYHGWLPLYAMAASFLAHGIGPDEPTGDHLAPRHDDASLVLRTRAARLPSIVFGILFMAGIFLAAREVFGREAAWAALVAASISTTTVTLARQARYYSLTLALSAFAALALARIYKRGERRDFVIAAVIFSLLFHTNTLAFVSAGGAFALLLPGLIRRGAMRHLLVFGAIVALATVPWVIATGFIAAAFVHPPARALAEWREATEYVSGRLLFALLAVGTLAAYTIVEALHSRLPRRVTQPIDEAGWGFAFLGAWAAVAFMAFQILVPAASYFYSRLTLVILVPALLFGAGLAATVARILTPRLTAVLAAWIYVALLASDEKTTMWWPETLPGRPAVLQVVDHLRSAPIEPASRLYADGGSSLVLQFYTGLPFRSVLPVRRSFLEQYPGPLVIVESPAGESLSGSDVTDALATMGVAVDARDAQQTARWFNEAAIRHEVATRGAHPVDNPLPGRAADDLEFEALTDARLRKSEALVSRVIEEAGNPIFRGFQIRNYRELWQVFFYRFVDPERRMGEHLNYARRLHGAVAHVLPRGWVVFRCPGRDEPPDQPAATAKRADQRGTENSSPQATPFASP